MTWDRQLSFLVEHCEFNTYQGRKILNNLDEAGKLSLSDKVVTALYKSAANKFRDIDFGEIELSRGDITRLKHYDTLNESLEALDDICIYTENNCPELQIVNESMKIAKAYKKEFCLSFLQDKAVGIMLYNTLVLSIICATNLCIAASVDFLRTPGSDMNTAMKIQKSADKNSNILIENLAKFNTLANNGDLKKLFDSFLKKENFIGTLGTVTVGSGVAVGTMALASALAFIAFVPVMRELIYFFYNFRMSVSDYFKTQAQFLEINLAELRTADIKNKSHIIKKHETRIKQLERISNTFEVKFNDSNKKTKKEVSAKIQPEKIDQILEPDAFQIM